jgi:CRISPR/Cas system-associated exonuclease Cas4 (RecB family)
MSFVKPRLYAWSYSRLTTWEECPAKAKYKFLEKLPEPASPYAARGTHLHTLAENYLQGKAELPMELHGVKEYLDELIGASTEHQLAYNEQWNPVAWFDPTVYCRVIFDAVLDKGPEVTIVDHKSGKKREEEHTDQLRLYALAGFKQYPVAQKINAQIIYLDHDERLTMEFHKHTESKLQEYWDDRAAKMRADDMFSPKPGKACRYCHFRKTNGGPCIF